MTYTKDDVNITVESVQLGDGTGDVTQTNFYLKLKNGSDFESFSVSEGDDLISLLNSSEGNPAKPYQVAIDYFGNLSNAFIWQLGAPSNPYAGTYTYSSGEEVSTDSIFQMAVNEKPGCICITLLNQSVNNNSGRGNPSGITINYTDENGIGGSFQLDIAFPILSHGEPVVYDNTNVTIEENSSAIVWSSPYIDYNVFNNYLTLKNGKNIKTFSVNQECHLSDPSAVPALPFSVIGTGAVLQNAFLWAPGSQQQATIEANTSSASNSNSEYTNPFGVQIPVDVNDYPGAICASLLQLDNSSVINKQYFYAYINFVDEDGVEGNVILGLNPDEDANTLSLMSWEDVFGAFTEMDLVFTGNTSASSASIYANNWNAVPVTCRLAATDNSTANVLIPLTQDDVANVATFINAANQQPLTYSFSRVGDDVWYYTDQDTGYTSVPEYGGQSAGLSFTEDAYQTAQFYVWASSESQVALTMALQATVKGVVYNTSEQNNNYQGDVSLYITGLSPKRYTQEDMSWTSIKQTHPNGWVDNCNITWLDNYCYYLDIASDDFHMTKVNIQNPEKAWDFQYKGDGFWRNISFDLTCYYGQPEQTVYIETSITTGYGLTFGETITINELPGLCYCVADMNTGCLWSGGGHTSDCYAEFTDNYGNNGRFKIVWDSDHTLNYYPA